MFTSVESSFTYWSLGNPAFAKIPAQHIVFAGETGSGKTVATMRTAYEFFKAGWTVIHLDSKGIDTGNERLEGAFCQFPYSKSQHFGAQNKFLKKYNIETPEMLPVKVWHPLTLDLPDKRVPKLNIFTIPVQSFTDSEIKFLLEDEERSTAFTIMLNCLRDLKRDDTLVEYVDKMHSYFQRKKKSVGKFEVSSPDLEHWGQPSMGLGNITHFADVASMLNPFQVHCFLQSEKDKLKLDIKDIMRDNGTVHVISTRYIRDNEKVRYFVRLWFLNSLLKEVKHIKKGVVIITEELSVFFPEKSKGFKRIFKDAYTNFMRQARTDGISTVSNTQTLSICDKTVGSLFNDIVFLRTHAPEEVNYYKQYLGLGRLVDEIMGLPIGYCKYLHHKDGSPQQIAWPPFAHKDEGEDFDELYKKYYLDMMEDYSGLVREYRELHVAAVNKVAEKVREKNKKIIEAVNKEGREAKRVEKAKVEFEKLKVAKKKAEQSIVFSDEELKTKIYGLVSEGFNTIQSLQAELASRYGWKGGKKWLVTKLKQWGFASDVTSPTKNKQEADVVEQEVEEVV